MNKELQDMIAIRDAAIDTLSNPDLELGICDNIFVKVDTSIYRSTFRDNFGSFVNLPIMEDIYSGNESFPIADPDKIKNSRELFQSYAGCHMNFWDDSKYGDSRRTTLSRFIDYMNQRIMYTNLISIAKNLYDKCPTNDGICAQIHNSVAVQFGDIIREYMKSEDMEHIFSGDNLYPIAHPITSDPCRAFKEARHSNTLWSGLYGGRRVEVLEGITRHIKKMTRRQLS